MGEFGGFAISGIQIFRFSKWGIPLKKSCPFFQYEDLGNSLNEVFLFFQYEDLGNSLNEVFLFFQYEDLGNSLNEVFLFFQYEDLGNSLNEVFLFFYFSLSRYIKENEKLIYSGMTALLENGDARKIWGMHNFGDAQFWGRSIFGRRTGISYLLLNVI